MEVRGLVLSYDLHLGGSRKIIDVTEVIHTEAVHLVVGDGEIKAQGKFLLLFGEEGVVAQGRYCGVLFKLLAKILDFFE